MTTQSLVVPIYKNAGNIPSLIEALEALHVALGGDLEVVFVVDGSPDDSHALLRTALPTASFASRLLLLSRNFGSFAAIREGLRAASGPHFAVMAADLQEPPELVEQFFRALATEAVDLVYGQREQRADPLLSRWAASTFWRVYRGFVQPEMPPGGVDVFGCGVAVRDHLLALPESNSSLVGLLFWLGFRRKAVPYVRRPRLIGKSAWTFGRKLKYLSDSLYAFSDLPVRVMSFAGALGLVVSVLLAALVFTARLLGAIDVPGYTATVLTISFFAALNSFGLGVIGSYVWRAYENTKARPAAIVMTTEQHEGRAARPPGVTP